LKPVGRLAVSLGGAAVVGSYWGIALAASAPGRRLVEGSLLWRVRTDRPVVALTFDDGPDPEYTERFLDVLSGWPSTFFVLGDKVNRWASVVRTAAGAGHEIASHGQTHRPFTRLSPRATIEEIRDAHTSIGNALGSPPRFYRPSHGLFNLAAWLAIPRLGMRRTLWTASSGDWEEQATPQSIRDRVLAAAAPGAILLMHDSGGRPGRPARTLEALPSILVGLRERGLQPVTLSDLVTSCRSAGPDLS
jgi:peptidoglycan/xylan/chitin deacetylase (PgdA/CDA1 family)